VEAGRFITSTDTADRNQALRSYPSTAYEIERRVLHGQILCRLERYCEAQRQMLELEAMEADPAELAAVYRVCSGDGGR
jgi:hypothetical protein